MFYFKIKKTIQEWLKNSRKGMAMLAAVAFMLVAGWQFGVSGTEAVFSEREVALENAIAGSNNPVCWDTITSQQASMVFYCGTCSWIEGTNSFWSHQRTICSGG